MAGRKRVYWLVAVLMIAGALGSALSGSFWMLIAFRFLLGFGVGGDYPVSAVMVSEYANRKDRGKLVGMVGTGFHEWSATQLSMRILPMESIRNGSFW